MIDKFTLNLAKILEDLYDNNESTVFNFIVRPDFDRVINFDIERLIQHFSKYPFEFIDKKYSKNF
jgi:hypothetical protein